MFGRIAAGLVHDLSHPIQKIGNSCKLIQRIFDDAEYRATFKKTVERELVDHQAGAGRSPQHRAADSARAVPGGPERGARGSGRGAWRRTPKRRGSRCASELSTETVFIEGDLFALGRVHRNLILNAIQATAPGGLMVVASEVPGDRASVQDLRHRLRHPAGADARDLRGLRDDEAPRARARAGDLQQDRRAARRADPRRERSRKGHDVRAGFPAERRRRRSPGSRDDHGDRFRFGGVMCS